MSPHNRNHTAQEPSSSPMTQIPLHPLSRSEQQGMLVPLLAIRTTPQKLEKRYAISFSDWWERGLGKTRVARVLVADGNDYILSWSGHMADRVLVEGWVPRRPSITPTPDAQQKAMADLGLHQDEVIL